MLPPVEEHLVTSPEPEKVEETQAPQHEETGKGDEADEQGLKCYILQTVQFPVDINV